MTSDALERIVYYENVLEHATNAPLQRADCNNWSLCRVCLRSNAEKFAKMCVIAGTDVLTVESVLLQIAGEEISPTADRLPQMLCQECLNKLSAFYSFHQQVRRANALLQRMFIKLQEAEHAELAPAPAPTTACNGASAKAPIIAQTANMAGDDAQQCVTAIATTSSDVRVVDEIAIIEYIEVDNEEFEIVEEKEYLLNYNHSMSNSSNDVITFNVETIPLNAVADVADVNEHADEMALKPQTKKQRKCNKEYKCSDCNRTFMHRQSLKRHSLLHATSAEHKRHECTVCGKSFARSDDWKRHMRVHTGQRPYGCPLCAKAFKQVSELNEHKLTHTKKDFPCDICGHRLRSRNGLYLHKKAHSGTKSCVCDYCKADGKDRRFMTNGELRSHWRVHQKQQQQST